MPCTTTITGHGRTMGTIFNELYDWIERTFWNSLSKKLMSFMLLFFIDTAYLGIYAYQKSWVSEELQRATVNPEVARRMLDSLDQGLMLMLGLTALALI